MRMQLPTTLVLALSLIFFLGCSKSSQETADTDLGADTANTQETPNPLSAGDTKSGKVLETMNTAGYTYVHVDTGEETLWSAAPEITVAVGDNVSFSTGMPMNNYHSKSLDRTFDKLYFSTAITVEGQAASIADGSAAPSGMPAADPDIPKPGHDSVKPDLSNLEKAEGGLTVAELFSANSNLQGKEVAVRGRVVKYTPNIMGKNWIHIQDGTGEPGTDDLTVTTTESAAVGNTVLVRGLVALDKDLGSGYFYPVIIEDAKVTVE